MTWQQWILIGLFAAKGLSTVARIDKELEPIDSRTAVGVVLIHGLLIWMVSTL